MGIEFASGSKVNHLRGIVHEESQLRLCYLVDSATKDKKGHADIKELSNQIIEKDNALVSLSKKRFKQLIQKKIWEVFDKEIKQ